MRALILCCTLLAWSPALVAAQAPVCTVGHLATVEPDGTVSGGSKERLRRAVETGVPIRVGWSVGANGDGAPDVTHWHDAGFLTIFEGEVFAQAQDIQRQNPTAGQARVVLPIGRHRWSSTISTTGRLEGHFDDGAEPTSMRVRSTWCVDPRSAACAPQWRLVYRHDADGKPLEGTREALLDAVRRGADIRVAWGFGGAMPNGRVAVEHAAEPVFLTIVNEAHVFVQSPEHIAQRTYHTPEGARFDKAGVVWRGLFGSDGSFDAIWTDRATGQEVRRLPQRAGLAWFAELPAPECSGPPAPTLAVANGVRRQ